MVAPQSVKELPNHGLLVAAHTHQWVHNARQCILCACLQFSACLVLSGNQVCMSFVDSCQCVLTPGRAIL